MNHCVLSFCHTLVHCGIAHVDGISAGFGQRGLIRDETAILFLCCLGIPHCACNKWILAVGVGAIVEREAFHRVKRVPVLAIIHFDIPGAKAWHVVVDDHLAALPGALTRTEHHGPGILEHGHEERHHDGLCEKILGSAEECGALPLPSAFVVVVISAVAGPEGYVSAFESTLRNLRPRHVCHPSVATVVDVAPCLSECGFGLSLAGQAYKSQEQGDDVSLLALAHNLKFSGRLPLKSL